MDKLTEEYQARLQHIIAQVEESEEGIITLNPPLEEFTRLVKALKDKGYEAAGYFSNLIPCALRVSRELKPKEWAAQIKETFPNLKSKKVPRHLLEDIQAELNLIGFGSKWSFPTGDDVVIEVWKEENNFDLEAALSGAEVRTLEGDEVTQLTKFDTTHPYPLRAVVKGKLTAYTLLGKRSTDPKLNKRGNLVTPCKGECWLNIYPTRQTVHSTQVSADITAEADLIKTIHVEWEI